MISGRSEKGRRIALWLALLLPALAQAGNWQQRVQQIAGHAQVPVRFEEQQYRFYLDEPLISRGEMRFEPPSRLIRQLESPQPMRLIIDGERLIRETADGERREVALDAHPLLAGLGRLLLALFAGDPQLLAGRFDIDYEEGPDQDWQMGLTPREKALQEWIRHIRLAGRGGILTRIEIVEVNDDRTVIRLWPADDRRP